MKRVCTKSCSFLVSPQAFDSSSSEKLKSLAWYYIRQLTSLEMHWRGQHGEQMLPCKETSERMLVLTTVWWQRTTGSPHRCLGWTLCSCRSLSVAAEHTEKKKDKWDARFKWMKMNHSMSQIIRGYTQPQICLHALCNAVLVAASGGENENHSDIIQILHSYKDKRPIKCCYLANSASITLLQIPLCMNTASI